MKHLQRIALAGFLLAASGLAADVAVASDSDICFRESGEVAIAACNRVISSARSTRNELVDAYSNRGQEYYAKKDYDRAISDFDAAIKLDSRAILAHGNRANAWYMKGQFDRAINDYTRAISLDREYTAAYAGRGLAFEKKGDKGRAIADYKAALSVKQKYQDGKWAHDNARQRLQVLEAK